MFLSVVMPDSAVAFDGHADDWHEAIRLVGRRLESSGSVDSSYKDQMVREVEKHGPYVVVAPGIALVHARPSPAVRGTCLGFVRLARPVAFGHPRFDPVRLLVGLAVTDEHTDLAIVSALAGVLNDPLCVGGLRSATSPSQVRRILGGGKSLEVRSPGAR